MSNETNESVAQDSIPSDLRALVQIAGGLQLVDRVIDDCLYQGSSSEAVAEARHFVKQQYAGVVAKIKSHPDADMVIQPQEVE